MAINPINEVNGVVTQALPNTLFKVKLEDDREILAHLGGKLRLYHIRVMPGDEVKVQLSGFNDGKGRIIFRLK